MLWKESAEMTLAHVDQGKSIKSVVVKAAPKNLLQAF